MLKKNWTKLIIFFVISLLLEVFVMNGRAVLTMNASDQQPEYFRDGDCLHVKGMTGEPGYIYLGISASAASGVQVPVAVSIWIQDEGQAEYYELPATRIYPLVEKSKYLRIHSYGDVHGMQIRMAADGDATLQVDKLIYDAKVPWFVSGIRIAVLFAGCCLVWFLRPGSSIYRVQLKRFVVQGVAVLLILINAGVFLVLATSNSAFMNPVWPYHRQYHELAVSLSKGEVSVEMAGESTKAALAELDNPYDSGIRMNEVPNAGDVWDVCYYEGKFYVYFGIVPVLIFYLPYYLLFGNVFPTWLGVVITGAAAVAGSFYLLWQIRRKWFPNVSETVYLLLATILSNCMNLSCAILKPDFYYLPVVMALCFSLWGLGILMSVACDWKHKTNKRICIKIVLGTLCMALTAGCRPQFLVGSFLLMPLFVPLLCKEDNKKYAVSRLVAAIVPYVIVAAALMSYNYIRFGSVLDFGANYNLTTNDMTHRGLNAGRVWDGLFMYLFQPANVSPGFPFAQVTQFYSEYLGSTIRDWTFGGAFWTHPILLILPFAAGMKKELSARKVYGFGLLCVSLSLVVVIADTQMAGILNRYYTDFLWLLMIPVAIVLFQLFEKYADTPAAKWMIGFVLIAGAWSVLYEIAIGIQSGELLVNNAHRYYLMKSLFR